MREKDKKGIRECETEGEESAPVPFGKARLVRRAEAGQAQEEGNFRELAWLNRLTAQANPVRTAVNRHAKKGDEREEQ